MNLFTYKDDFLSKSDFTAINSMAVKRYPVIENEDVRAKIWPKYPIRSRESQFPRGYTNLPTDIAVRYGKSAITAVDLIRSFLIDECSVEKPEIVNIWFAYMTSEKEMSWHCDGPVRDYPVEKCITTCLYIHNQWLPEWEGEILAKSGVSFSPVPNRLVVWSRDVIHKTTPILHRDPSIVRMLMATTWTTEGMK